MKVEIVRAMQPKALRERLNLTIEECAFWADVTPETYQEWEDQGHPVRRMLSAVNMAARPKFDVPNFED